MQHNTTLVYIDMSICSDTIRHLVDAKKRVENELDKPYLLIETYDVLREALMAIDDVLCDAGEETVNSVISNKE